MIQKCLANRCFGNYRYVLLLLHIITKLLTPRRNRACKLFQALINENHGHLVTLGVSHPSLEAIRSRTAEPYGLSTKLTGAGGGGCAVTLLPDGVYLFLFLTSQPLLTPWSLDFEPANLQDLVDDLIREKFEPYITSVGGSGLGILSPYLEQRNRDAVPSSSRTYEDVTFEQVTPPETPVPESQEHLSLSSSGGENTFRVPFETIPIDGLAEWANGQGQWLYV